MKGRLARIVNKMLPWAPRSERRARVSAARTEAGRSRERARRARELEDDLRRILADNHFAQIIYHGITGGGQEGD